MAVSANGLIAAESGSEDFLSHENWEFFCNLAKESGNFIVGRKTYEAVKKWKGEYNFDSLVGIEKVVISHSRIFVLDKGYLLATSPYDALAKLSKKGIQRALIVGGGNINAAFAKANLLDEIILNVNPVFIGKGMPVFTGQDFMMRSQLSAVEQYDNGIVTLRYQVSK